MPLRHVRQIRVMCVDDSGMVKESLQIILGNEPDIDLVGWCQSAEAMMEMSRETRAEIILLDATMPGCDPFEAMREMNTAMPDARVIIFSGHDDAALVEKAIEFGAWGFVSKNDQPSVIATAVRTVAAGSASFSNKVKPPRRQRVA